MILESSSYPNMCCLVEDNIDLSLSSAACDPCPNGSTTQTIGQWFPNFCQINRYMMPSWQYLPGFV
jgi:hypothetical protein